MLRYLTGYWPLLAGVVLVSVLCHISYRGGLNIGSARGEILLKQTQLEYQQQRNQILAGQAAQLAAAHTQYLEMVTASGEVERDYLAKIKTLETSNDQLKKRIASVTRVWQDKEGREHPVACVFTAGFVQQYNAAFGAASNGSAATTASDTGRTAAPVPATDTRLWDSGVSQRDVLASATRNGMQCQKLAAQVNGLLDYIGLSKTGAKP